MDYSVNFDVQNTARIYWKIIMYENNPTIRRRVNEYFRQINIQISRFYVYINQ